MNQYDVFYVSSELFVPTAVYQSALSAEEIFFFFVAMLQTFPSLFRYLSLTNLLLNLQTYSKIFYSLSHITSSLTKFIFSPRLRYKNIYLSLHLIFFYFLPFCVYFTM
jgi:hypothetical protein